MGQEILRSLESQTEFIRARRLALFASVPGEPDTQPLFDRIRETEREVLFPRCSERGELDFVPIAGWQELRPGRFGILEPAPELSAVPAASIELFLIPGVAFDRRGGRLGRGGGFYDRSLPAAACVWGVAFDFQWVDRVPTDDLDRRVDGVVTESGLARMTNSD